MAEPAYDDTESDVEAPADGSAESISAEWDKMELASEQQEQQEGADEREAAPDEQPTAQDAPTGQAEQAPADDNTPIPPPTNWSLNDQDTFKELTPKAQRFLLERSRGMEAAHTQRSQELSEIRRAIEPLAQSMQRYQGYFQETGARPEEVFNTLMQVDYGLRSGSVEQKYDILRSLIRSYGIPAPGEGGAPTQQQPQTIRDPRVDHVMNQVQAMQGQAQQAALRDQAAVAQSMRQRVADFATAAGEDGTPSHPYFGEVEAQMAALAQADVARGVQPDLEALYDQACYANPNVRQRILADQNAQATVQRQRTNAGKRRAGKGISGAGSSSKEQPTSIRDILNDAWESQAAT